MVSILPGERRTPGLAAGAPLKSLPMEEPPGSPWYRQGAALPGPPVVPSRFSCQGHSASRPPFVQACTGGGLALSYVHQDLRRRAGLSSLRGEDSDG